MKDPKASPAKEEATTRPNIIWVFGDQHRAQMLGVRGDPNAITPNIDTLAEYGVDFTNAVATCPLCCPARGTLLTGRYPNNCIPGHDYRMPEGQQTLADVFNDNGFHTAWFGKWHVDGGKVVNENGEVEWKTRPQHPSAPAGPKRETQQYKPREARGGFETWIGYENNNSPHNTWVHGHDEDGEVDLHRLPKFETDALSDLLIDYIRKRAEQQRAGSGKPFFAALSVQPPHDPYAAPEEFMKNFSPGRLELRKNVPDIPRVEERARRELAGAYAMVQNLDWNLGRIRKTLREEGLDTNTWIFFFSDHGDMHGSQGAFHKTNPFEESIKVPLIIGGGLDVQGQAIRKKEDVPVGLVDLAPTTLGLAGIETPDWMEGTDFSYIKNRGRNQPRPESEPDSAYFQLVVPTGHGDSTDKAWRGVITRDGWKYVCLENMDWLLFNLNEDPYEQANLAHNTVYAEKRKEMNHLLKSWIDRTGDSFPLPSY